MAIPEDVPVQVGKFIIPYDFIILYMDDNFQVPIILGRPFLATVGAVIDVQMGTISFQAYVTLHPTHLQCLSTPYPLRSPSMLILPLLFLRLNCLMET